MDVDGNGVIDRQEMANWILGKLNANSDGITHEAKPAEKKISKPKELQTYSFKNTYNVLLNCFERNN